MSKNILLLFSLFFISICISSAQSADPKGSVIEPSRKMRISIADTSNNAFFRTHSKFKEIWRTHLDNKLSHIRLRFIESNNRSWSSEYYDMNFEGDVYVFNENYGNSIHFVEPNTDFERIFGNFKLACSNNQIEQRTLQTIIVKDSIHFDFRLNCINNRLLRYGVERTPLGLPATYFGDLENLSQLIQQKIINGDSDNIPDSIVVFRGIVNKDGSMENLILEAGKQSFFSDAVKEVLNSPPGTPSLRKRKNWTPARTERGAIRSNIRFYAKLNEDSTVSLSTTRLLGMLKVID